ncbi:hypothetical protein B0H14DRAFT_2269147, partial [Mycena olivaceomarginata]
DFSTYISGLQDTRNALYTHATGCHSLFSPIRRVPPEILLEIFDFLSPACRKLKDEWFSFGKGSGYRDGTEHLLQCSQVCWRWRRAVTGTPSLW